MYQKILVPLDGSELAECVLPHVKAIAGGCRVADVVLARVVEPPVFIGGDDYTLTADQMRKIEAEARATAKKYISKVVSQLKLNGVSVKGEVIIGGRPADMLAEYANKNGVDLGVVATHGRSVISRWVWGSVADRIMRSSCVPVLMVRAPGCMPGI
ncbi:MAG: universal stress protein [Chloroflexota bacterium]